LAVLVNVSVTPGRRPPDSSRTTPARLAPIDWPAAGAPANSEMAIPMAATEFRVTEGPERNMRPNFLGVFGKQLEFAGFSIGGP